MQPFQNRLHCMLWEATWKACERKGNIVSPSTANGFWTYASCWVPETEGVLVGSGGNSIWCKLFMLPGTSDCFPLTCSWSSPLISPPNWLTSVSVTSFAATVPENCPAIISGDREVHSSMCFWRTFYNTIKCQLLLEQPIRLGYQSMLKMASLEWNAFSSYTSQLEMLVNGVLFFKVILL